MTRTIDWPRYSRWTWIVAALLLILLLVLWMAGHGPGSTPCCGTSVQPPPVAPAPVVPAAEPAATPAPVAATPGPLDFTQDGGKLVLRGIVPDQATRDRLLQAATAAYGAGNVTDGLTIDASRSASHCADQAGALFAALKAHPAVTLACNADSVTLGGHAASEDDKAASAQWAHDLFGPSLTLANQIVVDAPTTAAPVTPVARAEDVRCGDRITASVTFATGSARIDAAGRKLLDAIVPCLKEGSYDVAGYTDNVGSATLNAHLSKDRADTVRGYLIVKGIDAARLSAAGYGAEHPIADNATADGRAENRRIEFTKK